MKNLNNDNCNKKNFTNKKSKKRECRQWLISRKNKPTGKLQHRTNMKTIPSRNLITKFENL
jgi:hypothetical protein